MSLPAMIVGPVVFDGELNIHGRDTPAPVNAGVRRLEVIANQNFSDLNGIKSRTLAQIIGYHPEIDTIGHGVILADSPHISGVLTGCIDGHWVNILFRLVGDYDSRSFSQYRLDI